MERTPTRVNRRQLIVRAAAGGAAVALPGLAQAQNAEPLVIGQSAHLSGPLASTFTAVLKGQEMAIADTNRRGGVNGRKIKLISLDDAYDRAKCVDNVNKLIDEHKVLALYGLASTANVGAALPILAEKKVPLVCVYSGSPALRAKHHPYFFTTMASYRDEVVQMLRNLVTLQRGNVALIYQNSPFGQLMQPVVEEVAAEVGARVVAKAPIETSGADAVAATQAVAQAKPQAVIFMSFGPSLIPFVKAARSNIGAPIYCISIANSQALIHALGDESRGLAITNIVPYPWRATTPLLKEFHASMDAAKVPVDYDHLFGYLNVRILVEGIRRAGRNPTSASVTAGMESMRRTDLGGYHVDFSPNNHHGSKFVENTIVGPGGRYLR